MSKSRTKAVERAIETTSTLYHLVKDSLPTRLERVYFSIVISDLVASELEELQMCDVCGGELPDLCEGTVCKDCLTKEAG